MGKIIRYGLILASFVTLISCTSPYTSNPTNSGGQTTRHDPYVVNVKDIVLPDKTNYIEGEIFNPEGLSFTATWKINGKEKDLKGNYSICEDWTYRDEPLTSDVNKITFTLYKYSFDIDITVEESSIKGIEVTWNSLNENYLSGSTLDFSKISVQITDKDNVQTLTTDYQLLDNDEVIEFPKSYVPTSGNHLFTVKYLTFSQSKEIKVWDKKDLNVTNVEITNCTYNVTYEGEIIDLTKIIVKAKWEDQAKTVSFTETNPNYEIYDNNVLVPVERYASYAISSGEHIFTVRVNGTDGFFNVILDTFANIVITPILETREAYGVFKGAKFTDFYKVEAISSINSDRKIELDTSKYTLKVKRNGVEVDATYKNVFSVAGNIEVSANFETNGKTLTATKTIMVEEAMELVCSTNITQKTFPDNVHPNITWEVTDNGKIGSASWVKGYFPLQVEPEGCLIMNMKFYSATAQKVKIGFMMSRDRQSRLLNSYIFKTIKLNDEIITSDVSTEAYSLPDGTRDWTTYVYVELGEYQAKAGENILTLMEPGKGAKAICFNLFSFVIKGEKLGVDTCDHSCSLCGGCTSDNTDPICENKCTCHKCESQCLYCLGCKDLTCNESSFCSNKCQNKHQEILATDTDNITGIKANWEKVLSIESFEGDINVNYSSSSSSKVEIGLYMSEGPRMNATKFIGGIFSSVKLNNQELTSEATNLGTVNKWDQYYYVSLGEFDVVEGDNTLILTAISTAKKAINIKAFVFTPIN